MAQFRSGWWWWWWFSLCFGFLLAHLGEPFFGFSARRVDAHGAPGEQLARHGRSFLQVTGNQIDQCVDEDGMVIQRRQAPVRLHSQLSNPQKTCHFYSVSQLKGHCKSNSSVEKWSAANPT